MWFWNTSRNSMVFFFFLFSSFTLYIFQHFHIFFNLFFIFCNCFHHFNFVLCGCSSYNHFEFSLLLLQLQAMLIQTAVCVVKLPGSQPFFQNVFFFFFLFYLSSLTSKSEVNWHRVKKRANRVLYYFLQC